MERMGYRIYAMDVSFTVLAVLIASSMEYFHVTIVPVRQSHVSGW